MNLLRLLTLLSLLLICLKPADSRILRVSQQGDGTDGFTWETAYQSVGGALASANSGDEIWIEGDTYFETIDLLSNVGVYGGFSGTEENSEFHFRDPEVNQTVLDATGQNETVARAVNILNATLDGVTLRHGNHRDGGGARVFSSNLAIIDCNLFNNQLHVGGRFGGGVLCEFGSNLLLRDCEIARNQGVDGGGVSVGHASVLTMRSCEIRDNSAGTSDGGGLGAFNFDGSTEVTNCLFEGNSVSHVLSTGGGAYILSPATIRNCTFRNNMSRGGGTEGVLQFSKISV